MSKPGESQSAEHEQLNDAELDAVTGGAVAPLPTNQVTPVRPQAAPPGSSSSFDTEMMTLGGGFALPDSGK